MEEPISSKDDGWFEPLDVDFHHVHALDVIEQTGEQRIVQGRRVHPPERHVSVIQKVRASLPVAHRVRVSYVDVPLLKQLASTRFEILTELMQVEIFTERRRHRVTE